MNDYGELQRGLSVDRISVQEFVSRRFPFAKDQKHWVDGNCFYFASMLKARFPEGRIIYDVIEGHFLFYYQSLLVDAQGCKHFSSGIIPSKENPCLTKTKVFWDFFEYYDPLQYRRIIRDCVL